MCDIQLSAEGRLAPTPFVGVVGEAGAAEYLFQPLALLTVAPPLREIEAPARVGALPIEITEAAIAGDANGDGVVAVEDIGFAVAELFDGDGDLVSAVSGGGFPGAPGVDANDDERVTAADLTATIRLLVAQ